MRKLFVTAAVIATVATGASAHTCADMRRAFDGGNPEMGMNYVVEGLLPQFGRTLNINDQADITDSRAAIMYICKNGFADSLAEAGMKAAHYTRRFRAGAR